MSDESNQGRKVALVIGIIVLVIGGLGAWYYFLIYQPEQEAKEKARLEKLAREEAERKRKEEIAAQNKIRFDALIVQGDSVFALKDWETAQELYTQAAGLFPDQSYPQDQLALVNAELDKLAARQSAGEVQILSSPTGKYYVIVSSNVDGDLAMDYAKKLAQEGADVKVITPEANKRVYHRVAVGDYDNRQQAKEASTSLGTYGEGVWVLQY